MAENTQNKDLSEHAQPPTFSQRILARVPFLKDNTTSKEVDSTPQWYSRVIEGMNPNDQQAIQRLRSLFSAHGTHQRWYYAGSGADISPTFLAPYNTEHWMVDASYDPTHLLFRPSYAQELSEPYQTLGGTVETEVPWEEAWREKKQTVTVDGKTRLVLVGGKTQDRDTAPGSIDVIYTNPYSPTAGPDALIALKTGGYYVIGNDSSTSTQLELPSFEIGLEAFGIRKAQTVEIESFYFPQVGKVASTSNGRAMWCEVYEKSRPFTPEEEDILQLDSSLWEISVELDEFIFRFEPNSFPENLATKLEVDLSGVFIKYFDKLQHLKGNSNALAQQVRSHVEAYFQENSIMPESLRQHYLFPHRNEDEMINLYQKAAEIYRNVREQTESRFKSTQT